MDSAQAEGRRAIPITRASAGAVAARAAPIPEEAPVIQTIRSKGPMISGPGQRRYVRNGQIRSVDLSESGSAGNAGADRIRRAWHRT